MFINIDELTIEFNEMTESNQFPNDYLKRACTLFKIAKDVEKKEQFGNTLKGRKKIVILILCLVSFTLFVNNKGSFANDVVEKLQISTINDNSREILFFIFITSFAYSSTSYQNQN